MTSRLIHIDLIGPCQFASSMIALVEDNCVEQISHKISFDWHFAPLSHNALRITLTETFLIGPSIRNSAVSPYVTNKMVPNIMALGSLQLVLGYAKI